MSRKELVYNVFMSIHYGKHSLRYLGPVLWAKLPSRIRTLHSLAGFKRAVRGLDLEMLMGDGGCVDCLVCSAWFLDMVFCFCFCFCFSLFFFVFFVFVFVFLYLFFFFVFFLLFFCCFFLLDSDFLPSFRERFTYFTCKLFLY